MKTLTIYLLGRVLINLSKSNTVHYDTTRDTMSVILSTILYLQGKDFQIIENLSNQKRDLVAEIKIGKSNLENLKQQIKDTEETLKNNT